MTNIDYTKQYNQYARDAIYDKIIVSENIKLACKRHLSWFERDDIYFDYKCVDRCIKFISLMKHFSGACAGQPFILLPWQEWCIANIFGWKYKEDNTRVTHKVLMFMSRKSGKTAFAAAIALIGLLIDGEQGAEIDCIANNRQQAAIAFEMISNFSKSLDPKRKLIKTYRSEIKVPSTSSKVQVLSSDSMGLDGFSSSITILDEMHSMKTWDLYNVMVSSMGARKQPLMIVITTAGFLGRGYPLFTYRQTCVDILKGLKEDDSQFSALFELDENDEWDKEENWIKALPSLGQTVQYSYMREQITTAKNNPSQEVGVRTKNLNCFVQSKEVWIPDNYISKSMINVDMTQLKDEECFIGIDLSAVSDMTAVSVLFPPNKDRQYYPDKYIFKNLIYLPESTLDESINAELYKAFKRDKCIIFTPGNVVDYDYILNDLMKIYQSHYVLNIAYDEWNATQFVISATEEGLPMTPYSQALGNFNKPTKGFERLMRQGNVIIDYNNTTRWCFNNIVLKVDHNNNMKPTKTDYANKIDPVIAMLQALGGMYCNKRYTDSQIYVV